jgi:hypothetical protein
LEFEIISAAAENERFSHVEPEFRRPAIIFQAAHKTFTHDVKGAVEEHILEQIDSLHADDYEDQGRRRTALQSWLRCDRVLTGGSDMQHLVRAYSPNEDYDKDAPLPGLEHTAVAITARQLAENILASVRASAPRDRSLFSGGVFQRALRIALDSEACKAVNSSALIVALTVVLQHLEILYVPIVDSDSHYFSVTSWMRVQDRRTQVNAVAGPSQLAGSALAVQQWDNNREDREWNFVDMWPHRMVEIDILINLPTEYLFGKETTVELRTAFDWAGNNYDCKNPVHKLCVVVAIVTWQLRGHVFQRKDLQQVLKLKNLANGPREQIRAAILEEPWEQRSMAGLKSAQVHFNAWYGSLMNLLDARSPHRVNNLEKTGNHGAAWSTRARTLNRLFANSPADCGVL